MNRTAMPFREFCQRERFVLAYLLKEQRERDLLAEVTDVLKAALDLVHQLQLERGTSTQWLARAAQVGPHVLATVVAQAQQATARFLSAGACLDRLGHGRRFLATLSEAERGLEGLEGSRSQISSRQTDAQQVFRLYSETIARLMALVARASERCPLPRESQQLLALYQFVLLKEKAGQERATGAALLGGDFQTGLWSRLLALALEQTRAAEGFLRHCDSATRELWQAIETHEDVRAVAQWREWIRQAKPGDPWPPSDPADWFRRATARIDGLHRVEQSLLAVLRAEVEQGQSEWRAAFAKHGSELSGRRGLWMRSTKWRLERESQRTRAASAAFGAALSQQWWTDAEQHGRLVTNQRQEQHEAEARSQELGEALFSFTSAVHQALAGIDQSVATSLDRAAALRGQAETNRRRAEEVVVVTRQSTDSVNRVTQSVQGLSSTLGSVRARAEDCRTGAVASLSATRDFDLALAGLKNASGAIEGAVVSIVDLAGRTNLLSLNAAIEAARAGSSGAGFAVVAREVKSLASQTNGATNHIVDSLAEIQRAVETSSAHSDSIALVLGDIRDTFSATVEALGQEDQRVQGVAVHLNQVAAGASQVEGAMRELAGSALQTERAAQTMDETAQAAAQALQSIRRVVDAFVATVQQAR